MTHQPDQQKGTDVTVLPTSTSSKPLAPCGTPAAYQQHLLRGEATCGACREAGARYMKTYRASRPEYRERERIAQAVRTRAAAEVVRRHHREYQALVKEMRDRGAAT